MAHRMSKTPTWRSWQSMLARCNNPYSVSYPQYGGRGVTVCAKWRHFRGFLEDMGVRPEGTSLDRIDNAKGYETGNCRWATRAEQNRNRGKFVRGKTRKPVVIPKSHRPRGRPPVDDPADETIVFRVRSEDKERYAKAAAKAGETLSGWIKRVLDRASR